MGIRLIILDIDGTIIHRPTGFGISSKLVEAISEAKKHCIKICLCSGRPWFAMTEIIRTLNIDTPAICCNGAYITDGKTYVQIADLSRDLVEGCLRSSQKLNIGMILISCTNIYRILSDTLENTLYEEIKDIVNIKEDIMSVCLFVNENVTFEKLHACLQEELGELYYELNICKSEEGVLMITNKDADKGKAMLIVAEKLQILPEEIMAIGNEENDIPMIRTAGYGVAVANAEKAVKQSADYIVPDVWHNGVVDAIYKYALGT